MEAKSSEGPTNRNLVTTVGNPRDAGLTNGVNSHPPMDLTPRRTTRSPLEVSKPPDPVLPTLRITSSPELDNLDSSHQSRLGTAVGNGGGDLQPPVSGEYFCNSSEPLAYAVPVSSPTRRSGTTCSAPARGLRVFPRDVGITNGIDAQPPVDLTPRRTTRSLLGVSKPLDPVLSATRISSSSALDDLDSSHQSRLGTAVGSGERDLQPPPSGEYPCISSEPQAHAVPVSSPTRRSGTTHSASARGLRVYYQNTRGLRTKLDDVYLAALDSDYDVYVFSETWLDEQINSVQLFGDHFNVYRRDRSIANSIRTRGGGVLIAVSNTLDSGLIRDDRFTSIETIWVKIKLLSRNVFVGAVYIPPERRHDCSTMQLHLDAAECAATIADPTDVLLMLGDFNQPGLVWSPTGHGYAFPDPIASTTTPASRLLVDGAAFLGLSQISHVSNFQSHFLDLVFASANSLLDCAVNEAADVVVALDNFHPALDISIANDIAQHYDETSSADRLNFRKTDLALLRRSLNRIDWNAELNYTDIDSAVARFNCILLDCVSASVPRSQPPRKPPWTNATLRKLKRARAKSLRAFCSRRSPLTKQNFSVASNNYRSYNKFLYKRYVNRTQRNLCRNPKGFWSFVNTKRKENGLPSRLHLDNDIAMSPADKCSLFAKHFSSVFTNDSPTQAEIGRAVRDVPANVIDMDVFAVDVQMVITAICKIKSSYAPGPSIIPSAVLKKCSDILAAPLSTLFNLSLRLHKFPSQWKRSTMFPVFKKGDKCNIVNYRGITSLGVESKVFESLIYEKLFASCKQYISPYQHGFFPGRSVETNLISFTSFCMDQICKKLQVDVIYTDLKAAFDKVNHDILLAKLAKMGCSSGFCDWLRSYLVQRELSVCIGNSSSDCFSNSSGVPQGSTLGPLLFSLFVNDAAFVLQRGAKIVFRR